jgi:serine phosphatase RsbU (regulator of sigma subunit)
MLVAGLVYVILQKRASALFRRVLAGERRDHRTVLYDFGRALHEPSTRRELIPLITDTIGEALRSQRLAFLESVDGERLEVVYIDGVPLESVARHRLSPLLSRKLMQLTAPTDCRDLETDLPFGYLSPLDQQVIDALATEVIVPLRSKSGLRGLVLAGGATLGEPPAADELQLAETLAAESSIALENAQLHQRMQAQAHWRREVDVARDLQMRLMPHELPQVDALEISGLTLAADGVGGDAYDCFATSWGEIVTSIADASGKGVPGAILMANLQALVKSEGARREAPAEIVARINRRLCEMQKPERYITLGLARIDPLTGMLAYCNAGHPSPLLVRADGRIEELAAGGLPLGIRTQAIYGGGTTVMRSGDLLVLYTDGIIERRNGDEFFGGERLYDLVREHRRRSARGLQDLVLSAVRGFAATPLDDDTTLLVVKLL